MPAPVKVLARIRSWEGYGGVGDYARSHGNTEEVIEMFEAIQKGKYSCTSSGAVDNGETFDLVIIGGGLSGMSAAHQFKKKARGGGRCLILENHPMFGGQAKRNEFLVNGYRLMGPQASNSFVVIDRPGVAGYEMFSELGLPEDFQYRSYSEDLKPLQFDRTNYGFTLWHDLSPSVGYFFEDPAQGGEARWISDLWKNRLAETPYSEKVRQEFLIWRSTRKRYYTGGDFKVWLDTMTYSDYLQNVMGLSSEITDFANPVLASGLGLGCDAISAYGAYQISMPGFMGFTRRKRERRFEVSDWQSFPGGNDGFSRYQVKAIIPEAIDGSHSFEDILNNPVNFDVLDRPENSIRMRLGATALCVEHGDSREESDAVLVSYFKGGKVHRLKARGVVMATDSWINRRIVGDLPEKYRNAYRQFHRSAVMVVNVAVTNWRFLYRLGLTGCRWFEGFGFSCNIRQPMIVGNNSPPLHPDKPIVVTFYVPLFYPGLTIEEQGSKGRREILSTSYYDYEVMIREQMMKLFGRAGFDHGRDIAGIIINRWISAYVNPQPGFYFGKGGGEAPREVIRKPHGRIAFGHSELEGHQNWSGAFEGGKRAARQIMESL
jgi:spermidine dehydrogenase